MTTAYGSGTLRIPIARWEVRGTKACAFSKKRSAQKSNLKNAVLNKFALPLARCSIQIRRPMFSNTTKAMQLLDYSPARGCYENLMTRLQSMAGTICWRPRCRPLRATTNKALRSEERRGVKGVKLGDGRVER